MAARVHDFWETPGTGAEYLYAEVQAAWSAVDGIFARLSEISSALRIAPKPADSLRAARDCYENGTHALLVEPAGQFLRLQPIKRTLEAIQRYGREIAPSVVQRRERIDARFQNALARAAMDLCEPWRIWRRGNRENEWQSWDKRRAAHSKEATKLLERYAAWARRAAGAADDTGEHAGKSQEIWRRQERAVTALLQMEISLRDLGIVWLTAAEGFVDATQSEREAILSGAKETLEWLQSGADQPAPAAKLELVSAGERARGWQHSIEAEAAKRLPKQVELVTPGRHPHWRQAAARHAFLSSFTTHSQPQIQEIIERYWIPTAEIAREASRAQEIVEYWRETPPADSSGENGLLDDARHNATVMLEEHAHAPSGTDELEAELAAAFWTWNEEGSAAIEAAQFGWAEVLLQPGGRRILSRAVRQGEQRSQAAARRAGRWVSGRWDRVMEVLSGRVPPQPALEPVIRRATLRDTLSLPASKAELPGLYRLLFQIAPVEDRRFLVGRERELAGLQQAVADWEAGRFAACLVVGDRGSGKTSLLNCAVKEGFGGRNLIRGQFRERALSEVQIDGFLRHLLKLDDGADLLAAFAAERRILVIEECERIYLRKVGGFGGTDHLIHLIHRTAPTTLWIIVMNDKSARVLDAGTKLRRVFSHRINAQSVSRADLENAILERHRLSGLKLQFAPPPPDDPRIGRVKHWLGLHDSAQKLFFDSLYQQSEGVFRSAFDLWQSSIECVEGEYVRIRQPLDPAFSRFGNELAQEDHFTLLAIQEHGSLTREELAEVLCEGLDHSRSRLDRLFALGLIEDDPEHPGMRVRPEAQRFTNDMLRRANFT